MLGLFSLYLLIVLACLGHRGWCLANKYPPIAWVSEQMKTDEKCINPLLGRTMDQSHSEKQEGHGAGSQGVRVYVGPTTSQCCGLNCVSPPSFMC